MSVGLDQLTAEFRRSVEALLDQCKMNGVEMRPFFAVRSPQEQARLWRQSRSREEIEAATHRLQAGGAVFLARILVSMGAQHGPRVTNCLPGLSWHQWGEAVDCFWAVNGVAEWSASRLVDGVNGYHFYARMARASGLYPGGLWRSLKDWPHVQLRSEGSPIEAPNRSP